MKAAGEDESGSAAAAKTMATTEEGEGEGTGAAGAAEEEGGVAEEKEDGEASGAGEGEGEGEEEQSWGEEGEEGDEGEGEGEEEDDWSDLAPFDLYKSLGVAPKPPTTVKPLKTKPGAPASTPTPAPAPAPTNTKSTGGVVGGDSRLRAQFHRRSLKYHPSHFRPVRSGNTTPVLEQRRHAHLRFRQVALAFVVLKDSARREVYDSAGFNGLRQSESYADEENNVFWWDPFSIFDSFFR